MSLNCGIETRVYAMMKNAMCLAGVFAMLMFGALAQPESATNTPLAEAPAEAAADSSEESSADSSAAAPALVLEGDVVVFVSGKRLQGVHVVRETPIYVEIEYLPEEPALKIPRRQVDRIEYARDRSGSGGAASDDASLSLPDVMPGEEVSVDFHRALMAPLSSEEMLFEDADYLAVLRQLAERQGIVLEVAPALLETPEESRRFSRVIAPNTTMMSFLRRELLDVAPQLRVILQYDKILLQARPTPAEEASPAEASAPEASPAEASAPEASPAEASAPEEAPAE